jgi:hypothetical protein
MNDDTYVLSIVVCRTRFCWHKRETYIGSYESLSRQFDLKRLPKGAVLLRGKQAEAWLQEKAEEDRKYRKLYGGSIHEN